MSDTTKTRITQENLDSLIPAIRDVIMEEGNLNENANSLIDSLLVALLPHVFEVVEEGGAEISIEDVRERLREFFEAQVSEDSEHAEEPVAEENILPVVSLRIASTNEHKGIAHVTVKLETEPLKENLFVAVRASGGSSDTVIRRINAGKTESHPITVPTGRGITLSIVSFDAVEMSEEIRKKVKAPKELPPYTIINQNQEEESEESADE